MSLSFPSCEVQANTTEEGCEEAEIQLDQESGSYNLPTNPSGLGFPRGPYRFFCSLPCKNVSSGDGAALLPFL